MLKSRNGNFLRSWGEGKLIKQEYHTERWAEKEAKSAKDSFNLSPLVASRNHLSTCRAQQLLASSQSAVRQVSRDDGPGLAFKMSHVQARTSPPGVGMQRAPRPTLFFLKPRPWCSVCQSLDYTTREPPSAFWNIVKRDVTALLFIGASFLFSKDNHFTSLCKS